MRKRAVIILAVVILSLVTAACQSELATAPRVGRPAPEFQLPSLDGGAVSPADFRGSPVMLNFWASWCGPCVSEMPHIQAVYEEYSGRNLVILAINIGESRSQVKGFMADNQLTFPVLLDMDGKVADLYNVRGIPTTVFIDRDGIIQVMKVGAFPSQAAIERDLSKIFP